MPTLRASSSESSFRFALSASASACSSRERSFGGRLAPVAVERGARRLDRAVDLGLARELGRAERLARGRLDQVAGGGALDGLAVDEEPVLVGRDGHGRTIAATCASTEWREADLERRRLHVRRQQERVAELDDGELEPARRRPLLGDEAALAGLLRRRPPRRQRPPRRACSSAPRQRRRSARTSACTGRGRACRATCPRSASPCRRACRLEARTPPSGRPRAPAAERPILSATREHDHEDGQHADRGEDLRAGAHRSNSAAWPWPTPTHIVATP